MKEEYTIQEIVDMAKTPIDRNKKLVFSNQIKEQEKGWIRMCKDYAEQIKELKEIIEGDRTTIQFLNDTKAKERKQKEQLQEQIQVMQFAIKGDMKQEKYLRNEIKALKQKEAKWKVDLKQRI